MLTVYAIEKSRIYGHGERAVIWFSGCTLHCKGCINSYLWNAHSGKEYSVNALLDEIERFGAIRGVTYIGGEPLQQSAELLDLSKSLIASGKDIVLFTGYEQIELIGWQEELASLSAVVVFGRYDESRRNTNLLLRGSENQTIIINDPSIADYYKEEAKQVEVEITESETKFLGFPEDFV